MRLSDDFDPSFCPLYQKPRCSGCEAWDDTHACLIRKALDLAIILARIARPGVAYRIRLEEFRATS